MRIDLDSNRYCEDKCAITWDINRSDESYIQLAHGTKMLAGSAVEEDISISRVSGEYSATIKTYGISLSIRGRCEKAPFTGFAPPSTKF